MWDMIKAGYDGAKALFGFDEGDIIREGVEYYNRSREKAKTSRSQDLANIYASTSKESFPGRVEVGVRTPDASTNVSMINRGATSDAEIYSSKWTSIMRRAILQARETTPTLPITITSRKKETKTSKASVTT
tara:strand:- start:514 stop:909 length:396 start_codon:yes stop_codon:yes gene_type:complete